MTTIDLRNNNVNVTEGTYDYSVIANAKMFVIPNPVASINDFCCHQDRYKRSAEINNVDLSADDEWVEVWFHSEELDTENLCDHGCHVILEDGTNLNVHSGMCNHIPAKVLDGVKEGDTIEWKLEASTYMRGSEDEPKSVLLILNVTAQQKGYRYARFGNFEDVVRLVQH